jgi:hypothetical protein
LLFSDNDCIENEPIEAIMSKQNWIQEEKSYINIFKNDFELSNDVKDYVTSEEIQKWIDEKKLGITFTKFGMEMNKYCKIYKLENINSKDKKIQGKTRKVWVGIKSIEDTGNPI